MLAQQGIRAARREQTRRQILDAAWRLARRDGLAALSLRELAAEVGMRAPSLYTYFPSKDAIYDAMFAEGYAQLLEIDLEEPVSGDLDAFKRSMHKFMRFCAEDPTRYQLMFQRTIPGFEPSPDAYSLSVQTLEVLGRELEALGIDDPRAMDLWTAIASGLTSQQLTNDPGGDRWARLIDDAVEMFIGYVRKGRKGGRRK